MVVVVPGESERDFTRGGADARDVDTPYCGGVCGDVASGENRATRGGSTPPASSESVIGGTSGEMDMDICGEMVGDEYGIGVHDRITFVNRINQLEIK